MPFANLPWRWLRRDNGHVVLDSRGRMPGTPIDLDALTDDDLPFHLRRLIDRDIAIVIGAASLIAFIAAILAINMAPGSALLEHGLSWFAWAVIIPISLAVIVAVVNMAVAQVRGLWHGWHGLLLDRQGLTLVGLGGAQRIAWCALDDPAETLPRLSGRDGSRVDICLDGRDWLRDRASLVAFGDLVHRLSWPQETNTQTQTREQ